MNFGIIGAGVTGIILAYRLLQQGHNVTLIDKDSEIGGMSGSFLVGGSYLEKTYQYISEDDLAVLNLIEELSLGSELLWYSQSRGLYYKNKISLFNMPGDASKSGVNVLDKLYFYLCMNSIKNFSKWETIENITAEQWLRKVGGASLFKDIWSNLLKNRFDNNYNLVSAVFLRERSKLMGKRIGYFNGGFQRLLEVLGHEIRRRGTVKTSTSVKSISSVKNKIKVSTDKGILDFDRLIATIPVTTFMQITKDVPLEYNMKLETVRYTSLISMVLELKQAFCDYHVTEICDPASPFAEIIEHTNLISSEMYNGSYILYITAHSTPGSGHVNYTSQKLLADYVPFLRRINPRFDESWIKSFHLFKTEYAYPLFTTNYLRHLPEIKTPLDGIYLVSAAHIYPRERSLNSCINLANDVMEKFDFRQENTV